MVKINKRLFIYNFLKIVLTGQKKEDSEKKIQKQVAKYERDLRYGGIDCNGNFTRLHNRNEIYY